MVIILLSLMIGAAPAEDGRDEFQLGRRYYLDQRYEDALPWLERAYNLSRHRPSTILGLAQCERALGHVDDALLHYREYLATVPPEDEAATIRLEIGVLESNRPVPEIKELPKHDEPPPAPLVAPIVVVTQPPAEKKDEPSIFEQPLFWLAAAAALVAVGTGTALALNARSDTIDPWGGTLDQELRR